MTRSLAAHSCLPNCCSLTNNHKPTHTRTQELSSRQSVRLTEALAGSPRVLLSKLRELASLGLGAGGAADPLAQVGSRALQCRMCLISTFQFGAPSAYNRGCMPLSLP